jgi:hypothetical protein
MQKIIDRTHQYLAKGKSWYTRYLKDITQIVVHHSAYRHNNASNDQRLKTLASFHTKQHWPGLAYHYVIVEDGTIFKINNHEDLTWTDFDNIRSLSILVDGHFHRYDIPTLEQLRSLQRLLNDLVNNHPEFPAVRKDVKAHREVQATIAKGGTACCGANLYPYVKEYRETGAMSLLINKEIEEENTGIPKGQEALHNKKSINLNNMSKTAVENSNLVPQDKVYILSDIENNLKNYLNDRKEEIERLIKEREGFVTQKKYDQTIRELEQTKLALMEEKEKKPNSSQKKWYQSKKFLALIIGLIGLVAVNYFGSDLVMPYLGLIISYIFGQSYAEGGADIAETLTDIVSDGKITKDEINRINIKLSEGKKETE